MVIELCEWTDRQTDVLITILRNNPGSEVSIICKATKELVSFCVDWIKLLCPTQHKIGDFRDTYQQTTSCLFATEDTFCKNDAKFPLTSDAFKHQIVLFVLHAPYKHPTQEFVLGAWNPCTEICMHWDTDSCLLLSNSQNLCSYNQKVFPLPQKVTAVIALTL